MAALTKITGRRVEVLVQEIPNPPPAPQPSAPAGTSRIPAPVRAPARDPYNYLGGIVQENQFFAGTTLYKKTIFVSGVSYQASFSGRKQLSAWISAALVKLYPDYHPLARTVIPEWDYFNW